MSIPRNVTREQAAALHQIETVALGSTCAPVDRELLWDAHGRLLAEMERLNREREELADLLGDMAHHDCNCGDCFHCKARRYVEHECHDGDCMNDRIHDCHSSICKEGQPFVMRRSRQP